MNDFRTSHGPMPLWAALTLCICGVVGLGLYVAIERFTGCSPGQRLPWADGDAHFYTCRQGDRGQEGGL